MIISRKKYEEAIAKAVREAVDHAEERRMEKRWRR